MGGIIPIVDRLNHLSDSRSNIHVTYPLAEVLFIVYASILSGHNKWKRMEKFAKKTFEIGAKVIWLQYGIENEEAKKIANSKNIIYIANKCIKQEYQRLFLKISPVFPALKK